MARYSRRTFLHESMALGLASLLTQGGKPTHAGATWGRGEMRSTNHDDPGLHLFVDDDEVERIENLKRVLNRPRKHPTPVLVADRPWEGERVQAWGSVILEPDGLLRLWYFAFNTERKAGELDRGSYAYAESRDGLCWEKPHLGVVAFRGRTQNNLFYTCAPDGKNLVDEELARRGLGLPRSTRPAGRLG